jgi:hypothetical protein
LLPLSFEPVTFLLNKFLPSRVSALLSEFYEVIPESVSVDSFCGYANTSLQLIESECTLKPSDKTSPHHLSTEHISDSLQFGDLLERCSFELRSMNLAFCLELVDQVLVFVEVILRDSKQVDVHHFVG